MRTQTRIAVLTLLAFALVTPTAYLVAKPKTTLSINLEHDLDIRQLRGHTLSKLDEKKVLSKKTISGADFNQLVKQAKAFVDSKMKPHERDPELGQNGEGKSHVVITVTLNGKKKSVEFESGIEPGSVANAPAPFKAIAEKLRALAP
jgi:hypothetical protein